MWSGERQIHSTERRMGSRVRQVWNRDVCTVMEQGEICA
jgi:hypothetical protein